MLLHARLEEVAAREPDSVAVDFGGGSLSYGQLDHQAGLLARELHARGVRTGSVVGVCAERSPELVIALLGVLKAGAAYLPLDPSYPGRRLAETLEDAGSSVLLADALGRRAVAGATCAVVDLERAAWLSTAAPAVPAAARPGGLAYVIYTSGSTGRPKGVMCTHRGIVNRLRWMQERYELTPSDRVLHKTSIGFDVSVWELFWPLREGARLVLAGPGEQRDPEALGRTMRASEVTTVHFVPAMLAAFIASGQLDDVTSLRTVICSGEALPGGVRDRFFAHSGAHLHNLYGPTEASIDVTHHTCAEGEATAGVPIGRAIEGVDVRVVDERLQEVGPGVEGEICIAGVALARGYLGRPRLTAGAFVPDPLGDGERLYRTGDRGRLLPDGELEFLGRRDGQVKIRGVRIELGEVESALASRPGVERAAVVVADDGPAPRLVGYVTGSCDSTERLREGLAERLPQQAVPSALVHLDSLPTLPNGKTDRAAVAALAAPAVDRGGGSADGPATVEETTLARIWEETLGASSVAAEDNFFALGGDSILSIEVVARARAAGMRLTTSDVFAHPTLRDLAERAGGATTTREREIPDDAFALIDDDVRRRLPADVVDALPLSSLMSGLVAESFANPDYMLYTTTLGIQGRYDRAVLEAAVAGLAGRHPALRSAIDVETFDEPLQLVHRTVPIPVREVDAAGLSANAWQESFAEWLDRERRTPFRWARPPLVRFTVHRRRDDHWQLTMTEPFLDGWSATVALTELLSAYRGGIDGTAVELPPPPRVSNRDLVVGERAALRSVEHRDFWRRRLDEAPLTRLPRLAEPGQGVGRQLREPVPLSDDVSRRLPALARELDVPLKSLLLAAHARTVAALAGQSEVVCGLMVNGRSEEPDGGRAVGLFLNTLPLPLRVGSRSWTDLARAAYAAEAEALPWRRFPYARLLHDGGGRHLFDSVFNFTHFRPYAEFTSGSSVRLRSIEGSDQTYFPLTAQFSLDPFGGGVQLVLELNADGFAPLQVEQLVDLHARALAEIVERPDSPHWRGSLVGPRERSARAAWLGTRRRAVGRGARLETLFEQRVHASPDRIAVFDERERLTFSQVHDGAGRLALQVEDRCGGRPQRVGICMERSAAVLEAVVAASMLGAASVPLDLELPGPRLGALLGDAAPDLVIADERGAIAVSAADPASIPLRADELPREGPAGRRPAPARSPGDAAHVIYTSGSTGTPKGVVLSHLAIANRLRWMWGAHPFKADDVCCVRGSLGFVDSITSLLGGVLGGAPTYVLSGELEEPDAIARALDEAGVTRLTVVPAILRSLLKGCGARGLARLARIDHWVLSGEPLSGDLVDDLRRLAPHATVLNLYGSTEVGGDVTVHECGGGERGTVAAGTAIDGMRVRVLDRWGRDVPCGTVGEVTVEGPGLATAYLGDPRLTADRFRPAPEGVGARVFRTGDLGRHRADGALEVCGRRDRQVKVNGVRVEPAEVEAALASHPLVAACGVTAHRARADASPELIAFVELSAARRDGDVPRDLRDFLRGRLPGSMVPGRVVVEAALPRTASGKIDRTSLAHRVPEGASTAAPPSLGTATERIVAGIWADELEVDDVGPGDDFFELGGDSLSAVRVLARLGSRMSVKLTLRDFFDNPTVADLACRAELATRDGASGALPERGQVDRAVARGA